MNSVKGLRFVKGFVKGFEPVNGFFPVKHNFINASWGYVEKLFTTLHNPSQIQTAFCGNDGGNGLNE